MLTRKRRSKSKRNNTTNAGHPDSPTDTPTGGTPTEPPPHDHLNTYLVPQHGMHSMSTSANPLLQLFLPVGYPSSVRQGYLEYQIWDVVQGLTSYLRGNLAYQSMLVGLGVGDVEASATAGALTKIVRDTCSMLGSLMFTYFYSDEFGYNVRQWRLFADVSNDIGLTLHFLAPLFGKEWFVTITVIASLMTTMCGISAGATKAYISSHFALENNLTDLVSKEGSQETAVNVIGLIGGYCLLASVGTVEQSNAAVFISFFVLTVIHVVANVRAIHYLTFFFLNEERFQLVMDVMEPRLATYRLDEHVNIGHEDICRQEPLLPRVRCFNCRGHPTSDRIVLGSDHRALNPEAVQNALIRMAKECEFIHSFDMEDCIPKYVIVGACGTTHKLHVLFHQDATSEDILSARFECECLLRFGHDFFTIVLFCRQKIQMDVYFKKILSKYGWDTSKSNFKVGRTRYSDWPKGI